MEAEDEKIEKESDSNDSLEPDNAFASADEEGKPKKDVIEQEVETKEAEEEWKIWVENFDEDLKNKVLNFSKNVKSGPNGISIGGFTF